VTITVKVLTGASVLCASAALAHSIFLGPIVMPLTPESDKMVLSEYAKAIIKEHSKTFDRLQFRICATASIGGEKMVKRRLKALTKALRNEGIKKRDIVAGKDCAPPPSDGAVLFIQPIFNDGTADGTK
jgi:hypothetical protein